MHIHLRLLKQGTREKTPVPRFPCFGFEESDLVVAFVAATEEVEEIGERSGTGGIRLAKVKQAAEGEVQTLGVVVFAGC